MKATHAIVIVTVLTLVPVVYSGEPAKDKMPKAEDKSAVEMVDAIVNRNKAPKLVQVPRKYPSRVALFPEDHDWTEEVRVSKALVDLEKYRTEEVWEELVKRIGDQRYCETVTAVKSADASVHIVGVICEALAYSRLTNVYGQHLPRTRGKDDQEIPVSIAIGLDELPKWRKMRAAKSLYELQIEVCEMAISALAKVENVPQNQKDQSRKKIEDQIETMNKSTHPIHNLEGPDWSNWYIERGEYNAKVAKRVRDAVNSGKYQDLDFFDRP